MNAELLYEALNDRHSLEQLSERDLGRLVSNHPYFSIGQLLLAKKQRQSNNKESYQQQREHLHAFYRNPWWLYYQLELADHYATPAYVAQVPYRFETQTPPFESIARPAAVSEPEATVAPEAPRLSEPPMPQEPEVPLPLEPTVPSPAGPEASSAPAAEDHHRHGFVPWPGMEEEDVEIPTLMGVAAHEVVTREAGAHNAVSHEPASFESIARGAEPEAVAEPYLPYMVTSAVTEPPAAEAEAEAEAPISDLRNEEVTAAEILVADTPPVEAPVHAGPLPEDDPYADEDPDATDGPEQTPWATHETPPEVTHETPPEAPAESPALVNREDSPAPPPAFPTGEPAPFPFSVTPLAHDFTFEPLHTVDYFASQGIKLNLEENATDNLTRHLKSFTEWLKTMKRVSPMDGRHSDLDAATEAEIQQLASSANHQREAIVTESMAHVWVLQGKIHKAVEVYNKLSLQHPEKRAYFAAKIEQLNRL